VIGLLDSMGRALRAARASVFCSVVRPVLPPPRLLVWEAGWEPWIPGQRPDWVVMERPCNG